MNERLCQLALTLVPNIGDVQARILVQHCGSAAGIFQSRSEVLERIDGIGPFRARSIKDFNDFQLAEDELEFISKNGITPLFITDKSYPRRLLNCCDAPILLFYKGNADLNLSKVLAIVGTRRYSAYGKQFTEKLIADMAGENILIVSGLAYGIDAIAHKAAMENRLSTAAVVGHGLDKVYPYEHAALAREIVSQSSGMLSEFFSGTKPDKHNFPLRNRIVAGMSDATVVIETDIKGGSMITAKLADGYHRDVFAVPGRTTDRMSAGCNHLIKYNKAILLTDACELMEILGWKERGRQQTKKQTELFVDLSADENQVVRLLQEKEVLHIDDMNAQSGLSSSTVAAAILNLELKNVIVSLPGKMYRLL